MFDNQAICPYTGLRSFTEEESLYFKGREDDIDQATAQLQKNKFLMLTGASGDGKSSLIYAGIIPNARAGFLKSAYTQWCVADFRPERTPFQNLARSVSRQLDIPDVQIVEAELQHGFSALVDLYKNSKRYVDTNSRDWQLSDEKGRAALKRQAANLIVLVDQFEEFFTNPENYQHGHPSRESGLVLNLLLETARIALEEDLPLYVVFTMRSDYIGQCAAFRGLPEYLGFSQYFVPRLNRVQLQQVIEDPAELSGNRISRRLTERLIHDITEGVDQLPILQHALNQIWVAADSGKEEMDLIHYAMVGGMPATELPEEDVQRFTKWFSGLPDDIRACYHEPNLQNVLDTHTNKLYELAEVYYGEKTRQKLSDQEAKHVIRTAFTCLTKIDQGRAVRNRMTLQEITNVIGDPAFSTERVGAILNIFREPGNTFIHPFISDSEPDSQNLLPDQVLDITHESLIRNWKYLGRWANEEFDSRAISLDFEQQLGRWVESGKSRDFLLPIGPLTYFENWYDKARPNAYWIARYLPEDADNRLEKAKGILSNAQEFLKRSASKHAITRTVMRIGTQRIAAVLAGIALVALTSFAVTGYLSRQNSSVLKQMRTDALALLGSKKVTLASKGSMGVEAVLSGVVNIDEAINAAPDTVAKLNVATGLATQLVLQGYGTPREPLLRLLSVPDSLLASIQVPLDDAKHLRELLKEINDYRSVLELAYVYTADPRVLQWKKKNAELSAAWALAIAERQPSGFTTMNEWALSLEHGLNHAVYSPAEIQKLLGILSPFENANPTPWLRRSFRREALMDRGEQGYGFMFNGLYQELAYLYAASGNARGALQCMDSLLKYSQNNFQGDYAAGADNATNIAFVFYKYGQEPALDEFVKGYCERKRISEEEFYLRMAGRCIRERATAAALDLFFWMNVKLNLGLRYATSEDLSFVFNKYRQSIDRAKGDDHYNYQTALSYKFEGIMKDLLAHPDGKKDSSIDRLYEQAISQFRLVSASYQQQQMKVNGNSASEEVVVTKRYMFVFPDFRLEFHPLEPRAFLQHYHSNSFLDYIIKTGKFDEFYSGPADFKVFSDWMIGYNVKMFVSFSFLARPIRPEILTELSDLVLRKSLHRTQDLNLLFLELGYNSQKAGDEKSMLAAYRSLLPGNFLNVLQYKEYGNNVNERSFRLMAFAVKGLAQTDHFDEAYKIVSAFKKPSNRSSLYAFAAAEMLLEKKNEKMANVMIDSARKELARTSNIQQAQLNRRVLAYALALQDPRKNSEEIAQLIKNLPQKLAPNRSIAVAYAFHGMLHDAYVHAPGLLSDDDRAGNIWMILYGYMQRESNASAEWDAYRQNYLQLMVRNIFYEDESS